ncbi:tetratricopeptide repeat protein [Carboxylicivirga sp. N1Y90]|uniref:tetratricopeptide repeat protein n=1 Tax=Carboxylicivirga fragile TaxID=3417571 RepID=UPI003D347295|nr:tetratricopeptide repeat protein [Marinilabiliaceae bacterium N1Y90]
MMNVKELKSKHKAICTTLAGKKVKDALDLIQSLAKETHNGDIIDAHYNLEFTYKNILRYTVEGISDPERQKIYNHLVKDVYQLSDKIFTHLLDKYSSDMVSELQREFKDVELSSLLNEFSELWGSIELQKVLDANAENNSELQEWGYKMFQFLWSSESKVSIEIDSLHSYFKNESYPWHTKSLMVAAINLSLMHRFSPEYLRLLMDLMVSKDDQISARAITSLLIAFSKYDDRLPLYPDLYTRFFMLIEEYEMETLVQSIVIQLIRTQETEKISQKLHDEILPEVVKMQPKLKEKLDLENMLSENMMDDKNPEWDELFKDSPNLISKMEELTEWQMEGADVFLSTFQHLKHFSFFNNISNWLLPFYSKHPEIQKAIENEDDVFKNGSLLDGLGDSRFLCNSDKYSLILSIPHMPGMQKDLMGQMFSAELEQMAEIAKDEEALKANQGKLVASNQFIQDLYRLLKVHPQRHQLEDVFSERMDIHNKWFFKQLLGDINSLREIGEYYFKKEYYDDAIDIFQLLLSKDSNSEAISQKLAFCYQKLKQYDKALNMYLKADLLGDESVWNKKKVALCYRNLKQPEKALQYYKEAENIDPENLQTQASIGHCYLELENFEEALKYYFKVEYLALGNSKVGRPIAWCSFVLGKFDQAEKYYHKLLVAEKNKHDLINLGHTLWCKKLRKDALANYQKSIKLPDHSFSEFLDTFSEDLPYLKKHGIDAQDIPLMLDQIRYSLED